MNPLEVLDAVARPAQLVALICASELTSSTLKSVFDQEFQKESKTPLLAQAVYRASIIGSYSDKDLARAYLVPLVAEIVKGLGSELTHHQLLNAIYIAPELLAINNYSCSSFFMSIDKAQMHWLWANPYSFSVMSRYLDRYIDEVLAAGEQPANFLALCVSYVSARLAREPRPVLDKCWRTGVEIGIRKSQGNEGVSLLGPSFLEGPRAKPVFSAPIAWRKRLSVAICITGQLRGFERAVASWAEFLQPDANYEFFLSTWGTTGAKDFSWQHMYRFVDQAAGAALIAYRDRVGVEKATQACREFFSTKGEPVDVYKVAGLLKRYGQLASYSLVDEDGLEVNNLSNPEKMYFHNSNVLDLVGDTLNDFDLVLKIRPDILVGYRRMPDFWLHIERQCALRQVVYAESGFRYEEWGFGCGDQIGIGTPHNMREYMSVWREKDYHNLYARSIRGSGEPVFGGHTSLGVQLFRRGIDVNVAPLELRGLASDPLRTTKDIIALLER